ncbi:hypothetical protein VMCG_01113 [Cytospora schulzeri]|uniref:2EXR domain-containing protein n=1 Tax=Cytospora schulzeri TaxID=448051 RepID=A0A423X5W8_9PEZI|nr:hypothetical protein VMCG_01113 [Valsa malicola]
MVVTCSRAENPKGTFLKFPKLPAELRDKIWNEAMPRHGLYPVQVWATYETLSTPNKCVISLKPSHPREHDPAFSERIQVTRDLLMVCRESRAEVKRRFPDTVPCRNGEMRFNAEKDTIFAIMDRCRFWTGRFFMGPLKPAQFEFTNDWNSIVRKLAVESRLISASFSTLSGTAGPLDHDESGMLMNNFMAFISRFALKQLVLVAEGLITADYWGLMDESSQCDLREDLEKVYRSGIIRGRTVKLSVLRQPSLRSLLIEGAHYLKAILHAYPDTKGRAYGPGFPRGRLIKSRYPELSRLDVVGMVHLERELMAQGICREMEFG